MSVTKTTNKIHFEDLDPLRFENLISCMVYRMAGRWQTIYPFGQKGIDDGIDIGAIELLENGKERTHHFQCKRYTKLSKAQLRKIIDDYLDKNYVIPDKYTLVTACDLSKKNIEDFQTYAISKGFKAVDIWTGTFIETKLYAEHHDLLFAYFGISLVKQRNDAIASLRRNISLKHKMRKDFIKPINEINIERTRKFQYPYEKFIYQEILIRSIDDTTYPNAELQKGHYGFQKAEIYDFYYNGLVVFAYTYTQDIVVEEYKSDKKGKAVRAAALGHIPYNNIIDYDLSGDEIYQHPHVFCDCANGNSPYEFIKYAQRTETGYRILNDDVIIEVK